MKKFKLFSVIILVPLLFSGCESEEEKEARRIQEQVKVQQELQELKRKEEEEKKQRLIQEKIKFYQERREQRERRSKEGERAIKEWEEQQKQQTQTNGG